MNGFIRKAVLLSWLLGAAGVGAQTCDSCGQGCYGQACGHGHGGLKPPFVPPPAANSMEMTGHNNKDLYDRCWPTRYSNLAHRAVNRAITPQVQNGFVLDQTVWNHMFEPGTDILNPMGQAHLQYVSRRRPEPDRTVYLATSMDLAYDPHCPDRYCGARQELDALRVAAIQKFLVGLNCGRCQDFQVLVHDPADVTLHTQPVYSAVTQMYGRFRGGLATGAGGGGGSAGASGSVGGFAGSGGATAR